MYMEHLKTYAMEMKLTFKPVFWMGWNVKPVNQLQMLVYVNQLKIYANIQIINALQFCARNLRNPFVN